MSNDDGAGGTRRKPDGPAGAEFLHLEVSRWLEGEGRARADDLVRALLHDAIRARLQERLGERLQALGRAIADEIADDLEANLEIEERIDARREARQAAVQRARAALRGPGPARKRR